MEAPGPVREVHRVCLMCFNACPMMVRVAGSTIVGVEGSPNGPNQGRLCPRGISSIMHIYDPHRLGHPLKRTNHKKGIGVDPGFVEITWEEALSTMAERLAQARREDPHLVRISTMDVHRHLPFACWATAFGTPHVGGGAGGDHCGNSLHVVDNIVHGAFMEFVDYEHCEYLIIWGCGAATESYLSLSIDAKRLADARRRGMKLVVIDPRMSVAATKADRWVPIRPGTDGALALGMANVLVNELGRFDEHFLKAQTNAPYLIGGDGYYVRDKRSAKPLVWDGAEGHARAYDVPETKDCALTGSYQVDGATVKPAFQLVRDRLREYTPETVHQITTVPAETVRVLAGEWGEHARIGSTISLDGQTYPHRPVAAVFNKGIGGQKHAAVDAMALLLLPTLVGSMDVPGGNLRDDHASLSRSQPVPLSQDSDGLVLGVEHPMWAKPQFSFPPARWDLKEYMPIAYSPGQVLHFTAAEPDRYGLRGQPVNIFVVSNPMFTMGGNAMMARALSRSYNIVCGVALDETAEFADLVIPEPTFLERYSARGFRHDDTTGLVFNTPVVPPPADMPDLMEMLFEVAERLGFLRGDKGVNFWFNQMYGLRAPYTLDLGRRYAWAEVLDAYARSNSGPEYGAEWFAQRGFRLRRRSCAEKYQPYRQARLPLYHEFILRTGRELRAKMVELDIEGKLGVRWDFSDYVALPEWKPSPVHQAPPDYDLCAVTYKTVLSTHGRGTHNPWLAEVMEREPYVLRAWMNSDTARVRGLSDGDTVWVESPVGKVKARLKVTELVHPEVVAFATIMGHWAGHPLGQGKGAHFNTLIDVSWETTDLVSGALAVANAKVKVYRA